MKYAAPVTDGGAGAADAAVAKDLADYRISTDPSIYQKGGYTMPGLDRTGPQGNGPMSGWGQGLCNSDSVAEQQERGGGFGQGGGRRRGGRMGRCARNRFGRSGGPNRSQNRIDNR